MTFSSFLTDPNQSLVADASVLINLNATGYASRILQSFPGPLVVTGNVFAELAIGASKGHPDAKLVQDLFDVRAANLVEWIDPADQIYRSLVDGAAAQTLDDGEAATIAYAHRVSGVALIDERKAISLCASRFPNLDTATTADLLMHHLVRVGLGRKNQIRAVTNALRGARMRVPPDQVELVVNLIGPDQAANCDSLPRRRRMTS